MFLHISNLGYLFGNTYSSNLSTHVKSTNQ